MKTFAEKTKRPTHPDRRSRAAVPPFFTPAAQVQRAQVRQVLRAPRVQTKLTISQPNDKYEQEADRMADEVMRMPEPVVQRQTEEDDKEEMTQSKPIGEQITPLVQRQPEPEEEEEIQTKAEGATPQITPNLESQINALRGGGQPLPKEIRNFFEPRFGRDFSQVRVHTASNANHLARGINAKAFTKGNDVVFGGGEYNPESSSGKRLLGHELTHVVQQKNKQTNIRDIQLKNVAKARFESVILDNIPFDSNPKRELFFESEVLKKLNDKLINISIPDHWEPDLMRTSNFHNDVYKKLKNMKPTPKTVTLTVDFKKGATIDGSHLWFAVVQTSSVSLPNVRKSKERHRKLYNMKLFGKKYKKVTLKQIAIIVGDLARHYKDWIESEYNAHLFLRELHEKNKIVALSTDIVSGEQMPPVKMWSRPLKDLSIVKSLLDSGEVIAAEHILVAAEISYDYCHRRFYEYRNANIKAAEHIRTGLEITEVAGTIAATVATGGLAAEAELGFVGSSLASSLGQSTYNVFLNLGKQASEEAWVGIRQEIDWNDIWGNFSTDAIAYFIGNLLIGPLKSKLFKACKEYFELDVIDKEINNILKEFRRSGVIKGIQYIRPTDFIPMWKRYGIEYLTAMGSKALKEPLRVVIKEYKNKGKLPTTDEFLKKLGLQFWVKRSSLELIIRYLVVRMPLDR